MDLNPLTLLALPHLKVHTLQSALTQQKVHPSTYKTKPLHAAGTFTQTSDRCNGPQKTHLWSDNSLKQV